MKLEINDRGHWLGLGVTAYELPTRVGAHVFVAENLS